MDLCSLANSGMHMRPPTQEASFLMPVCCLASAEAADAPELRTELETPQPLPRQQSASPSSDAAPPTCGPETVVSRGTHATCGCGMTYAGLMAVKKTGEAVKKARHAAGGAMKTARESAAKACQTAKESLKAKGKGMARARASHRRSRAGLDAAAAAASKEASSTTTQEQAEVAPVAAPANQALPQRSSVSSG